jgi:hypothetical protein
LGGLEENMASFEGYSPAHGSNRIAHRPNTHILTPKPRVIVPVAKGRTEYGGRGTSEAFKAVLRLALEGQTLPLDVSRELLSIPVQQRVIRRVEATLEQMNASGVKVDMGMACMRLQEVDRIAVETVKRS